MPSIAINTQIMEMQSKIGLEALSKQLHTVRYTGKPFAVEFAVVLSTPDIFETATPWKLMSDAEFNIVRCHVSPKKQDPPNQHIDPRRFNEFVASGAFHFERYTVSLASQLIKNRQRRYYGNSRHILRRITRFSQNYQSAPADTINGKFNLHAAK